MSAAISSSSACVCAAKTSRRPVQASLRQSAGLRPQSAPLRSLQPALVAQPLARQAPAFRQNVKTAAAMEIYQVADELSYITGVAGVCFAITLVGLAVGFVLLRVEALTEEGKL
ncbi:probable cytochrome b6-f complex subunit 7, chloroplastic [Coccomyxa sp. Obi]|nr:probable cytochrome b6-f complex subunit 7, chloroplastic [Coccomyxa sp. Obi]